MPLSHRVFSVAALAALLGAAGPADTVQPVWHPYTAELARQCPSRHLDLLAPAELRDALDHYKGHLATGTRLAMDRAEARHCAGVTAGATCNNMGDVDVALHQGLLPALASSVCGQFETCRSQSDCDPASAQGLQRTIDARGAHAVAASLSDAEWNLALDEAAAGRSDWLDAIADLRSVTDGARSEGIDKAMSDALLTNPAEVLRLVATRPGLPRLPWLCQDRSIEATAPDVKRHTGAALAAVREVKDLPLAAFRDQCLAALRRQPG